MYKATNLRCYLSCSIESLNSPVIVVEVAVGFCEGVLMNVCLYEDALLS